MSGFTVQEAFHRFYSVYRLNHPVNAEQEKAAFCIMNCKTGKLGANVSMGTTIWWASFFALNTALRLEILRSDD